MTSFNPNIDYAAQLTVSELLRTKFGDFRDLARKHGDPVAQRIKKGAIVPSTATAGQNGGMWFQVVTSHADTARSSRNASKDFDLPATFKSSQIRVRFDIDDPSSNDINRIESGFRLHLSEIRAAGLDAGRAVDIAERAAMDATEGVKLTSERLMHADENAVLGTVDGAPKNADSNLYDSATAYTAGSSTACLRMDGLPIGFIKRGMRLDFITSNSSTPLANEIEVTDINEVDQSFRVKRTARTTVGANLDAVVTGSRIVMSGEFGQGYKGGFGSLFKTEAQQVGENWFGGVDRSTATYRWLQPVKVREALAGTTSVAPMSSRLLDQAIRGMSQRLGDDFDSGVNWAVCTGEILLDNWRNSIGDGVMTTRASGTRSGLATGETGAIMYTHGSGQKLDVVSTRTARNDRVYLWDPERLEMLAGDFAEWVWLSDNPQNILQRVQGTGANGEGTVKYKAEGLCYQAPFTRDLESMACIYALE